jgi:aspartate carbamoyltransferase catalytic subunit
VTSPPIGPHLLGIDGLTRADIVTVLDTADEFAEVSRREIPKVPALRGRTVASVFFEPSTRTRLSFESAAKRLSADTMTFAPATSSLGKGESVRDTVQTLEAMGADCLVVRHRSAGVPRQVTRWVDAVVINAGDGTHEHPTQALLDCMTIRRHLDTVEGVHVAIVGDIAHSRVARSEVLALRTLGAEVTLVGPRTLMPPDVEGWGVAVSADLDAVLATVDVVYLLRMQLERQQEALVPSMREYHERFGLTSARAASLRAETLVMHPGPMNRGIELAGDVPELERSVVLEQVTNGVALRMAVLYLLLGGPREHDKPDADGVSPQETTKR